MVEHVTTVSNSNASCFRVVLSGVELRWVLTIDPGYRRENEYDHYCQDCLETHCKEMSWACEWQGGQCRGNIYQMILN